MSKCLAIKTADNTLEPTAQANAVATAIKLAVLQKQAMGGLGFNTKVIIEESGDWTAPVTGTYKVTVIGGGWGGHISGNNIVVGGLSGATETKFFQLEKNQVVSITIGAGGIGSTTDSSVTPGGATSFGDFTPDSNVNLAGEVAYVNNWSSGNFQVDCHGGGLGGGAGYYTTDNPDTQNGSWYGAGGGAWASQGVSARPSRVGNGHKGCVIIEYFDPEKASLPAINDTDLIPYVNLIKRVESLEKSRVYNAEEWITESGTYTVPVDGWYEVTLIGGGNGASVSITDSAAQARGGCSGDYKTFYLPLSEGQEIAVSVGAGGTGVDYSTTGTDTSILNGGLTTFGDLSTVGVSADSWRGFSSSNDGKFDNSAAHSNGEGFGGGRSEHKDGSFYGAGGYGGAYRSGGTKQLGNGYQGAVRLRYYDPSKDNNN